MLAREGYSLQNLDETQLSIPCQANDKLVGYQLLPICETSQRRVTSPVLYETGVLMHNANGMYVSNPSFLAIRPGNMSEDPEPRGWFSTPTRDCFIADEGRCHSGANFPGYVLSL